MATIEVTLCPTSGREVLDCLCDSCIRLRHAMVPELQSCPKCVDLEHQLSTLRATVKEMLEYQYDRLPVYWRKQLVELLDYEKE